MGLTETGRSEANGRGGGSGTGEAGTVVVDFVVVVFFFFTQLCCCPGSRHVLRFVQESGGKRVSSNGRNGQYVMSSEGEGEARADLAACPGASRFPEAGVSEAPHSCPPESRGPDWHTPARQQRGGPVLQARMTSPLPSKTRPEVVPDVSLGPATYYSTGPAENNLPR